MGVDFSIVVSTENTQYLAWQTQLLCVSALSRLNQRPMVVVHRTRKALRAEFNILKELGCHIVEAPSFRRHPKGLYLPRNMPGSMLAAAASPNLNAEYILFCDPDMLFVTPLEYEPGITAESCPYLDYEEPQVKVVARKFGIEDMINQLNLTSRFGYPLIVPRECVGRLGSRWLEVLDSFETLHWIDAMYAFGLALAIEGLHAKTTYKVNSNYVQKEPVTGSLIHYCHGDAEWNKRFFIRKSPLDVPDDLLPTARHGSILSEIVTQIREARRLLRPFSLFESGRGRSRRRLAWFRRALAQTITALVCKFFR